MALIDTAYLSAFQPHPTDYISLFTRGYNLGAAMPWSEENRRKRALEDFQIAMKQQQFAAQQAEQAQQMAMRKALFPFQLQHAQRLASGLTDTPQTSNKFQGYLDQLRQIQTPAPTPTPAPQPLPTPSQVSPPTPFGVDPDAPVF